LTPEKPAPRRGSLSRVAGPATRLDNEMIEIDGVVWIELRPALYGLGGLFADVRLRDARRLFSRIIKRKSRSGMPHRYVPADEVEKLQIAIANGSLNS
jgi:hypothetical protein